MSICVIFQVDYIVQVEDSLTLRRYGKLPYIKYSNDTKRNWFLAKRDKMRGVDYKSQKKLVEELYEEAFDSEGEHKVHTLYMSLYIHLQRPHQVYPDDLLGQKIMLYI